MPVSKWRHKWANCTCIKVVVSDPELDPDASRAATVQAAMAILEPLAGLLLARQLRHADAEELLKAAFVQAAAKAFEQREQHPSASSLSVATGIRRREVTRLMAAPLATTPRKVPMASQARLLWITDPDYQDSHGQPRRLPRTAPEGEASFARLAAAISKDVHPRALLEELLRTGAVDEDGDHIVLRQRLFAHSPKQDAAMDIAGANVGDHVAAVLHNLEEQGPPLTERAIFADGLTQASAQRGAELARDVWAKALVDLRSKLQALVSLDADAPDNHWRMRIGMYSYFAPEAAPCTPDTAKPVATPADQGAEAPKRPRGRPRKTKPDQHD
jgi:Family of unknown function (DUF6502)